MRRRTVVLAALVAGVLVLAATGRTWVTATGLEGSVVPSATASGGRVSPVGTALALVVMAAALALTTARRAGMLLIGLVMAVSGVVIASAAITAALDPAAAAAGAVAEVTGTTAPAAGYAVSAWPWVSGLGGVLALALGVLTLVAGRGWAQSRRYEAPSAEPVGDAVAQDRRPGTVDRMDAWDELSRGEDPT